MIGILALILQKIIENFPRGNMGHSFYIWIWFKRSKTNFQFGCVFFQENTNISQ